MWGLTHKDLVDSDAELLVLLIGTDETVSQSVHSRSSYKADEIVWGAKFANMFLRTEAGGIIGMNLSRIHDIEMVYAGVVELQAGHSEILTPGKAMKIRSSLVLSVLYAPLTTHAQDTPAPAFNPSPQIAVPGRGEIKVSPDRATIQISVQTRASTAAAAAAENANKQQAVLTALRALGLGNDQLSTINYNVYPEQRYEQGKEPVIVAYNVTNTILADVRKLTQVGPVIDAALSHGANMITSLQFYASNTEVARRTAIATAIEKARADADAAAKAAHGTLGTLLEISIGSYSPPPPRPMMMMAKQAQSDTPINPGEETLAVEVSTRWRFIPGQ